MLDEITAVIVNHRTLRLTKVSFEGLLECYPGLQILLVDNGSQDESTAYIEEMARSLPNVSAILNRPHPEAPMPPPPPEVEGLSERYPGDSIVRDQLWSTGNLGHTGALHQAFCLCKTRYIFTLDSDCIVLRCGFLQKMLEEFSNPLVYGVGYLYAGPDGPLKLPHREVHASIALWDIEKYETLPPFEFPNGIGHAHFRAADRMGYELLDFPVGGRFRRYDRAGNLVQPHDDFVSHLCRGSRKIVKHPSPPGSHARQVRPELMDLMFWGAKTEYVGSYFGPCDENDPRRWNPKNIRRWEYFKCEGEIRVRKRAK